MNSTSQTSQTSVAINTEMSQRIQQKFISALGSHHASQALLAYARRSKLNT